MAAFIPLSRRLEEGCEGDSRKFHHQTTHTAFTAVEVDGNDDSRSIPYNECQHRETSALSNGGKPQPFPLLGPGEDDAFATPQNMQKNSCKGHYTATVLNPRKLLLSSSQITLKTGFWRTNAITAYSMPCPPCLE